MTGTDGTGGASGGCNTPCRGASDRPRAVDLDSRRERPWRLLSWTAAAIYARPRLRGRGRYPATRPRRRLVIKSVMSRSANLAPGYTIIGPARRSPTLKVAPPRAPVWRGGGAGESRGRSDKDIRSYARCRARRCAGHAARSGAARDAIGPERADRTAQLTRAEPQSDMTLPDWRQRHAARQV